MEITINDKILKIDKEVYDFIEFIGAKIYISSGENSYPLVVFGYANNKSVNQDLHRFVMGCPNFVTVDHINRNVLDCRIKNLRYATKRQQIFNRGKNRKGLGYSSVYKGVSWSKKRMKWQSTIYYDGKQYNLGYSDNEEDAAKKYNKKASELMGEFAYLNEINSTF